MMFAGFLQRFTYSTLCFLLLFLTSFQTAIAEEDTSEPIDPEPNSVLVTIDKPTTGSIFNTNDIFVTGTINPQDATIQLYLNDVLVDSHIERMEDTWQTILEPLNEGEYELIAKVVDAEEPHESNIVYFTIDTTPPDIEITNLADGDYTNETLIKGQTESNLPVQLFLNGVQVTDENNTIYTDATGFWSFDLKGIITEGTHFISAEATDEAGNQGYSSVTEFTFDQTRPFIAADVFPRNHMTRVSLNTVIKINLVDDHGITERDLFTHPLEVFKKGGTEKVPGTFTFNQKANHQLEIIFIPDHPLDPAQKYIVTTNPFLTDRAGNFVHPRIWSFTTTSVMSSKKPHGDYTSNVNTCITCHRTHTASNPVLKEPSAELSEHIDSEQAFKSYCMACHDGTVAAVPESWGESSTHHFQLITNEGRVVSQSCGSCHNPHLSWSERNPNIYQDHFTFNHTADLDGIDEPFFADSKEQLCESCHEKDSLMRKIDERVHYSAFTYKNWNSSSYELAEDKESFGEADDYTLCLRCHNASYEQGYQNIVDIETYYKGATSAHFITNDRVKDGSLLNGHMPCADCHNSHGSENVKMVKGELGHNLTQPFSFTTEQWTEGDGWTVSQERSFCLTCHNNSTELYGMTVSFKKTDEDDEVIPGHEGSSTQSCATCHGGESQSFLEAVHAPSRQ